MAGGCPDCARAREWLTPIPESCPASPQRPTTTPSLSPQGPGARPTPFPMGVRPQPYECTVVVSMPCDDGVAIRPEDVTDALERMGAHVLQWHDENLLESGDDA